MRAMPFVNLARTNKGEKSTRFHLPKSIFSNEQKKMSVETIHSISPSSYGVPSVICMIKGHTTVHLVSLRVNMSHDIMRKKSIRCYSAHSHCSAPYFECLHSIWILSARFGNGMEKYSRKVLSIFFACVCCSCVATRQLQWRMHAIFEAIRRFELRKIYCKNRNS